ncbi:hypothetical protein L3X38_017613 [Prunus dulcis]|uniref:Uncharacterized protein n=1 Tax=Prunus dulcis TaxID=3755 RepID=A0AAD4WA71_PRUDU|nr:hypothetical protein L3X38_017613 [Prunus dulcis]
MGLDGLIPVDEEEDVIYTRDAENGVRHQLRGNNVRSQYQNIEAHFYDQVLQDDAIIAVDIWPPPRIKLPYVPKPQGLDLLHVPDPEDEAYLELMDLDALSTEFVSSAALVPVIPHLKIIDISSDDE